MYSCLSSSVREIRFACCWDVKQPTNNNNNQGLLHENLLKAECQGKESSRSAWAGLLAQFPLTLGSFWHEDALFGCFPACLDFIESESTLLLSEPKGSMKHTKDCTTNNDIT